MNGSVKWDLVERKSMGRENRLGKPTQCWAFCWGPTPRWREAWLSGHVELVGLWIGTSGMVCFCFRCLDVKGILQPQPVVDVFEIRDDFGRFVPGRVGCLTPRLVPHAPSPKAGGYWEGEDGVVESLSQQAQQAKHTPSRRRGCGITRKCRAKRPRWSGTSWKCVLTPVGACL